jgi:hypothetical protein
MPITDRRPAESRSCLEVDVVQAPAGGHARGELRDRDAELDETASVNA